jgi:AraC-like DNA-binding protein
MLALQNDVRRLGELKLAALQRQQHSAEETEARLVSYLDENHIYTPGYMKTLADKLQAVGRAKRRLAQEAENQAKVLLECQRRMGQVERALENVAEDARRHDERRELDAMIEADLNRKRASLP